MKFILAAIFALSLIFAPPATVVDNYHPFRLDDTEGKAAHHIHFTNIVEGDSCSSTAIGPHALLTATHCELGTDIVDVDGVNYAIAARIRDGNDHTILILPSAKFTVFLALDQRVPRQGERIRGWGWPGDVPNSIYKEGLFMRPIDVDAPIDGLLFAFPIFSGDSGGGVITDEGKIITVVSLGDSKAHMVGFPLAFTPDQLAQVNR